MLFLIFSRFEGNFGVSGFTHGKWCLIYRFVPRVLESMWMNRLFSCSLSIFKTLSSKPNTAFQQHNFRHFLAISQPFLVSFSLKNKLCKKHFATTGDKNFLKSVTMAEKGEDVLANLRKSVKAQVHFCWDYFYINMVAICYCNVE